MLIFLFGEDDFRSHQKTLELKNKFLQSDKSGSGLSAFDFQDKISVNKVIDVLNLPNLLAPKRLVLVKNIISSGSLDSQKEILEYLKKNSKTLEEDKDLIIVFWESVLPPKTNALNKFLQSRENIKKQNFEKLSGTKLNQWILKRMLELDAEAKISQPALDKLLIYVGSDTNVLDKEIQKLVNFASGRMITEEDAEDLVKANLDANIFATVDALGRNDKKLAFQLLHRHLEKGDDPFYILSMFVYQFRNMLKVADFREKGITDERQIAAQTKLHPYVVKKSLAQVRSLSFQKLKQIYKKLGEIDFQIKTGKIGIELALDKFVAEL